MNLRTLGRWALVLLAGALLLAGRFDWHEAGGKFAWQAYASSLYFFAIAVPFSYLLTRRLASERLARIVGGIVFVLGSAPYRLLGLGGLRHETVIASYTSRAQPPIAWFPAALLEPGAGEGWLLLAFVAVVSPVAWIVLRDRRRALPFIAIAVAIALQSFLHTGMRSPYSYVAHLERAGKWYHDYLLPDGKGIVGADVPFFVSLDDHFNGLPKPVSTLLIRRSFYHYLGSPLTYFFNPYYVYLALNCLLWLIAALATYGFIRRVTQSEERARYAAALVVVANGFVSFVAQPMSYLASFAMIPIALYLAEILLVESKERTDTILYGLYVGMCAATYDFAPYFAMLLLYALFRGVALKRIAIALAIGALVPWGFLLVQFQLLRIEGGSNTYLLANAAANWIQLIAHPSPSVLFEKLSHFVIVYAQDLLYAFVVITTIVGLAGIVLESDRRLTRLFLLLLLPTVLVNGFFYFGGVQWGRVSMAALPRLSFTAFPAFYLGAALALAALRERLARSRARKLAPAAPWIFVALVCLLHNADAFGRFMEPSYHFFWPTPIQCDPYAKDLSCAESR